MNSPLLIGCDLTTIKSTSLALLKNEELIALNQDPLCQQAYIVGKSNNCYILVRDIETLNGTKRAFAIYNPNDAAKTVKVSFADLCLGGKVKLRDLFSKSDKGTYTNTFSVTVPTHGTRIYLAEGESRLERTRYEAETAYISDYQELKNNVAEQTGIYEYADYCSAGLKAGWLGQSEQNDLQWRDVYSQNGGEYKLTIAYITAESRNICVDVNGQRVQTISANSGGWSTVATNSLTVQLQKGRNTIRLSNATGWMPDIDYIELKPTTMPNDIGSLRATADTSTLPAFDVAGRTATSNTTIRIEKGKKVIGR